MRIGEEKGWVEGASGFMVASDRALSGVPPSPRSSRRSKGEQPFILMMQREVHWY